MFLISSLNLSEAIFRVGGMLLIERWRLLGRGDSGFSIIYGTFRRIGFFGFRTRKCLVTLVNFVLRNIEEQYTIFTPRNENSLKLFLCEHLRRKRNASDKIQLCRLYSYGDFVTCQSVDSVYIPTCMLCNNGDT